MRTLKRKREREEGGVYSEIQPKEQVTARRGEEGGGEETMRSEGSKAGGWGRESRI